jgi:hypothetical protein
LEEGERIAWLTLALTPGITLPRLKKLIETCLTPSGALAAPLALLETGSRIESEHRGVGSRREDGPGPIASWTI